MRHDVSSEQLHTSTVYFCMYMHSTLSAAEVVMVCQRSSPEWRFYFLDDLCRVVTPGPPSGVGHEAHGCHPPAPSGASSASEELLDLLHDEHDCHSCRRSTQGAMVRSQGTSSLNTSVSIWAYVCKIGILGNSFHTFIFLFVSLFVYVSTYPFIHTFSSVRIVNRHERKYIKRSVPTGVVYILTCRTVPLEGRWS